ncbi:MAG: sigma-70 family RNA polymerase sigma factor [Deltaproteobacteria bacterium]|nr:sigma-70 family RNA polymerase sigma factor [Deltaproteobacteria bacterium]
MARDKAHSRKEFEGLLYPILPSLYGMALRLTTDENDAQDLVQEATLRAFRWFHTFQPGTNFRAWTFRILVNLFITNYHRKNRRIQAETDLEAPEHYQRIVGNSTWRNARNTEDDVMDRLTDRDIIAALDQLHDEFRTAVVLSDIQGFSYREIAEIMDCPVGTVMSRLYRGRRTMQNLLYEHALERGIIPKKTSTLDDDKKKVTNLEEFRHKRR